MFGYYGSKSRIAKYYPLPLHPIIIEPFAGAARYSLVHWDKKVWINDSYPVISGIWKYLLQATAEQIQALPLMERGQDVRDLNLSEAERNLLGFCVSLGVSYPRNICSKWATTERDKHIGGRIGSTKRVILKNLEHVRHWKITNLDYKDLPNPEATWFIDPPYQKGGKRYIHNVINYEELANWCKSRNGQVIVCEGVGANWLPFRPFITQKGQRELNYKESIWTN
jgi:site-specific DNA-adenine methylase